LQLCSACRGDYEDPDASAMNDEASVSEEDEDADDEDGDCGSGEEISRATRAAVRLTRREREPARAKRGG
jgi:hypothetical protein